MAAVHRTCVVTPVSGVKAETLHRFALGGLRAAGCELHLEGAAIRHASAKL